MKKFEKMHFRKRQFGYGMIAAAAFAALFVLTYPGRVEGVPLEQYEIVAFGDSVFGETRDETAVLAQIGALTGKTVYNAALGGTCAARTDADRRLDYGKDSLSLAGLARAVGAKDFGPQQAARIRENATEYFAETVDGLEQADFSRVEIVLIEHGLNDYHGGVPIENTEDPYDEYTFLGALRSAVASLRRRNPQMRIVLVTPTYTWYLATGLTCQEMDEGGGVLENYVEALHRAAAELDLEIIDVYYDFLPHEKWEDWERYTKDGVHPNEAGRKRLAEKIAEELGGIK